MLHKQIIIKQIWSSIGIKPNQKATLKALGLRKINHVKHHEDTANIMGMIKKVSHLVTVEQVNK